MNDRDRFWDNLDMSGGPDDCWIWTRCRNKNGYGLFKARGKVVRSHRFAYEAENGPIPNGFHVLHRCDNPPCCNPAHLALGTHKDNMVDKEQKGRGNHPVGDCNGSRLHPESRPRGEQNGRAKLDEDQVVEIRALYAAGGVSLRKLADQFVVDHTTIHRIVRGEIWRPGTMPKADLVGGQCNI